MNEKAVIIIIIFGVFLFSCEVEEITNALTINCDEGGATNPSGTINVNIGEKTDITAYPEGGYSFSGWSVVEGTGVSFDDPGSPATSVLLTQGNATIYAHFIGGVQHTNFEYNVIEYEQSTSEWGEMSFINDYETPPVVVMNLLSFNDSTRAMMRVKDVTVNGFHFKIDHWDDYYHPSPHSSETISYMVVENGKHSFFNNTLTVLAGITEVNRDWEMISFTAPFQAGNTPVVVSQCMSHNDVDYFSVVTRQQNITHEGFELKLQERDANIDIESSHQEEEVGWIAFKKEYSSYPGMRFEIFQTPVAVNDAWYRLPFYNLYIHTPFFLAAMQTYYGNQTAALRSRNLTEISVDFRTEEDPTSSSFSHSDESVGYICIELY